VHGLEPWKQKDSKIEPREEDENGTWIRKSGKRS
jgi:hypothetical protein